MLEYLTKRPDLTKGFRLMKKWNAVTPSKMNRSASVLYTANTVLSDLETIHQKASPFGLLAFLRYDYKKILIRTRFLYIDRIFRRKKGQLSGSDLDYAFFEPILLCFPCLEFLGRISFPSLYNPPHSRATNKILTAMLKQMGGGYATHATRLVDWHRNALALEFRPHGKWIYDLNTKNKYGEPSVDANDRIYLNIPHFIDSCINEIEKICDLLIDPHHSARVMSNFSKYWNKRKTDV